mgnify:CR=1 FL=1
MLKYYNFKTTDGWYEHKPKTVTDNEKGSNPDTVKK